MAKATSSAVFSAVVSREFGSVTAPLANATFVAFRNPEGLNPDGVVWQLLDGVWHCVAWDGEDYAPGDVEDMELELVDAVADGVTNFYFGSECSREEFFEYVFGHEPESDVAFGPDFDYPPHMEAPESMYALDGWHFYSFTLDPEKVEAQEHELREALERLDESVHVEMYGHSYKA